MKKKIIIGVSIAVVLILGIIIFHKSDEDRIKESLDTLKEGLEKTGDEGVYRLLSKVDKVSTLFTENCDIEIKTPSYIIKGKKKLQQDVGAVLKFVKKLTVSFHDLTIEIKSDTSAATLMTATASVPGEGGMNAVEVEIKWIKVEGEWLIDKVRQIETFK